VDEFANLNISRPNWDAWLDELRSIGFTNPLLNFERNDFGQVDLERAHPGGLAQLVSARSTVLSNLFRDPLAFSRAYSAAKRIKDHSETLASQFGIDGLGLVGGLVNLEHAGFDLSLPILIWPIALERRTDDFELRILAEPRVNPGLISALEVSLGINLDAEAILAEARAGHDLLPISVLTKISHLVGPDSNAETGRILVVSNFSTEPIELAQDLKRTETPLLRELIAIEQPGEPVRELNAPILIADADATQELVVARAVAGQSFAVETLPGCGYTQTLVNTVAALANAGKSVLVLAPRRQTLNELADRFASLGLGGLGIRGHSTWLDLISAISRHEKAAAVDFDVAKVRYQAAAADAQKYFDLLVKEDSKVGITLTQALEHLAKLSLMPHPPRTSARISFDDLLKHRDQTAAIDLLLRADDLGEFEFGPQDSAWFAARFASEQEVERAIALAQRLASDTFEALRSQIDEFIARVGFKPASTSEDWGRYLRLFVGVRETLGRFVPEVFARPLDELIVATGPRTASSAMSGSNRRRLKKLAKEYVRPGMHVADLHETLVAASEQREEWKVCSLSDSTPDVPNGINDVSVAFQAFIADLNSLQQHLDDDDTAKPLARLSLEELKNTLNSMATNVKPLENLAQRNALHSELKDAGLTLLARDLAALKVNREHIALELDLAWWQSALEYLIARDQSVMTYTRDQIDAIEKAYKDAGTKLVGLGAQAIAQNAASRWQQALAKNELESQALKAVLKTRTADLRTIQRAAPTIAKVLAPVVMASPFELPRLLVADQKFDVVIIADAAGTTLAENLAGLRRAEQIIAFGDEAIAAPDGFELECQDPMLANIVTNDSRRKSIFAVVREVYGVETLRKSWRPNGQMLGSMINQEFYQNRIQFVPTPEELFGKSTLSVEILKTGIGVVAKTVGAVESPDSEVDRVVSMVIEHATQSPELSLLVATASQLHATRIESSISKARRRSSQLDEWFDAHGRERFEITPISKLSHRVADRIIFSIGFSVGADSMAPENLGDLSMVEGRRYLANLLVSARFRLDIISCFSAQQIASGGPLDPHAILREVLNAQPASQEIQGDSDPLLEDLSLRLKKLGAHVSENFGGTLRLVAAFGKSAAVVYPDWALQGENLNERLRLRPALLEGMGWQVVRVHSFELFSDPEALAIRIAESLGMQVSKRPQALFDTPSFDETDAAWGDRSDSNDQRLKSDKPPHWG